MLRFAGFELNQQRAELRGPDGEAIRLRPKPFAMLHVLAANAGRIVSKRELMEAVWPYVHVGEDSLFQSAGATRTQHSSNRGWPLGLDIRWRCISTRFSMPAHRPAAPKS